MDVILREITESDLRLIMEWRMSEEITKYMNTNPKLTLDGQKKWLENIRANADVQFWLIEIQGQPAGVISIEGLDREDGVIEWAYYIGEKKLRDTRIALSLEMSLYDYALITLKKQAVVADVFSLNKGVIALHKICGCEVVGVKKDHVLKEGIYYDITSMRMTAAKWEALREKKTYDTIDFTGGCENE